MGKLWLDHDPNKLFGFQEFGTSDDAQFWLDHERGVFITHVFLIRAGGVIRSEGDHFVGYLHLIEKIEIPVTAIADETLYEKEHDVWDAGALVCGQHGVDCTACDIARYWLKTKASEWVCYPRMTPDGRLFLAGICSVPGDALFNLRLE